MKRILCIVLALVIFALCFVSCSKDNESESKPDSSTPVSTPETSGTENSGTGEESSETSSDDQWRGENGDYVSPNEKIDTVAVFGEEYAEFHVLVKGDDNGTYQSDDFTTGSELYGDTLDTAVSQRNAYILDNYGVTIVPHKEKNINNLIREDINVGGQYDLVMPNIPFLATLASEGSLIDLYTLEDINIDAPWYDQNANETFSMNHQLFFTTGDITILNKVCTASIIFGKELLATNPDLEDPYQLVRDHQWTYDKMKQMSRLVTADTDGEAGMTVNDTWGFLTSYGDVVNLFGGFGMHMCEKDANDYPYFSLGYDERAQTILQEILVDYAEEGTWRVFAEKFPPDIWVTSLDAIEDGKILFRPSAFSATTKLRKRGVNFGIIPLPLYDENQDDYFAYCGTGQTAGFGILDSCRNAEFSAYMLDAISASSKNFVTRAYMEVNLKGKDAQDDEDLEMLEIIFGNILYDIGDVNNFGTIKTLIYNLAQQGSTEVTAMIESNRGPIETAIEDAIEAYQARQD